MTSSIQVNVNCKISFWIVDQLIYGERCRAKRESGYGEKLGGWVGRKLGKDGFRKLEGIIGFGRLSKLRVRRNNDIAAIKRRKYTESC